MTGTKMRKFTFLALPLTIALSGCQTGMNYDRANTTQQQMLADRNDCLKQSMGYAGGGGWVYGQGYQSYGAAMPNAGMTFNCMAAKGYTMNPNGSLKVPDNLRVQTY